MLLIQTITALVFLVGALQQWYGLTMVLFVVHTAFLLWYYLS